MKREVIQGALEKVLLTIENLDKMSVLDVFAREGDWNSHLIYDRCQKMECWEIDPTFENYLNYKYVKNVSQLVEIHNSSDFAINTRFTKFILQLNESDFNYFTENVNDESLKKIAFNAFGNKYDKIPKYIGNLKKIINLAKIEFIKHLNL